MLGLVTTLSERGKVIGREGVTEGEKRMFRSAYHRIVKLPIARLQEHCVVCQQRWCRWVLNQTGGREGREGGKERGRKGGREIFRSLQQSKDQDQARVQIKTRTMKVSSCGEIG